MSPEETRARYVQIGLEAWELAAAGWERHHDSERDWFLTRRPQIDVESGTSFAKEPHSFRFTGGDAKQNSLMKLRELILNDILDAIEAA